MLSVVVCAALLVGPPPSPPTPLSQGGRGGVRQQTLSFRLPLSLRWERGLGGEGIHPASRAEQRTMENMAASYRW